MFRWQNVIVSICLCIVTGAASAALSDGLISAWTFDDGTANDSFGNNDGALMGGAEIVDANHAGFGNAVNLNGTDAFVEIPHSDSMNAMADGLTAACWFFVRGNTQEFPSFFWKGLQVGWSPGFLFQISFRHSGTAIIHFGSCTDSVEGWFNTNEGAVDDGQWHHVATTADGKELNAYFDGEQRIELQSSFTGGNAPLPLAGPYNVFPDQPIRIGMSQGLGGNAFNDPGPLERRAFIDGMIDEAVIYSRALSPEEIKQLMSASIGTGVDPKAKLAAIWANLKTY
ncbi:MAG: LamG domain-containing protein [Candidatus Poribacteria bacterium]|nr:LamG domain-containing protein [Candidatus Poribacteria bacterium]